MALLNAGLGICLPDMTRLIHVLLTPSFCAIASFAPRGLVSKNCVSVIETPFVGLSASYTKKNKCATGLYFFIKFGTVRHDSNVKENYEQRIRDAPTSAGKNANA
jgi:hypothetical protein